MKGKAWLVVLACLLPGIGVVSAAHAQSSPREDMKDACRDLTRELGSFDPGILDCLESANGKSDVAQCLSGRETRRDYGLDQCVAKRRLVQLGASGSATQPTTARTAASGKKKEKRIGCLKIVPNPTGAYGAQALLNSCGDRVDFSFCYLSQEEASWNSWGCKRNAQGHYGRGSDSVDPGKTQVLPESTRNTRVAFVACEKGALPFIVGLDFGNGRTVIECR